MSSPDSDEPQRPPLGPEAEPDKSSRSTIGTLLWIIVLVALIAAGLWWYSEQTQVPGGQPLASPGTPLVERQAPGQDPAMAEAPAPGQPVLSPDTVKPSTQESTPAPPRAPAPAPAASAKADSDPVPLASNRVPRYPGQALRSGVEGSVSVLIEVNANGVPTDVRVVGRSGERSRHLDRAVVTAAHGWRFDPATREGRAVPGQVILPVDFKRD